MEDISVATVRNQIIEQFQKLIRISFDIREGEGLRAFLMFTHIFLIITSLLIVKPVCSALFLSRFGVVQLPYVFILVAGSAAVLSVYYSRLLKNYNLFSIMNKTLYGAIYSLVVFWVLIYFNLFEDIATYLFYIWVAVFAIISSSQFWILANSIFNPREAKRLFGFIGSGAIAGGIFGGYLTNFLAPFIGSENLIFICILFYAACILITNELQKKTATNQYIYQIRQREQINKATDHPVRIIKSSRHLTYLAGIIGISVLAGKLVEYQFSAVATASFYDEDELAAFFGFWLSNLNIVSLVIQLFLTRRVVGVFGVGTSLFFLPVSILIGAAAVLINPALWSAIMLKVSDGSLKNSINKAGIELLILPIPVDIKNQAKAFIDIFIDSFATGIGGFLLLGVTLIFGVGIREISVLLIILLVFWLITVNRVRQEYIHSFRLKLNHFQDAEQEPVKAQKNESIIGGILNVLQGKDNQKILSTLLMIKEIQNDRLIPGLEKLLKHRSQSIRLEVLRNLYFYRSRDFSDLIKDLINDNNQDIKTEAIHYLYQHTPIKKNELLLGFIISEDRAIRLAALLCAARESRNNPRLKQLFHVREHIEKIMKALPEIADPDESKFIKSNCAKVIGAANIPELFPYLHILLNDSSRDVVNVALVNAGQSLQKEFIPFIIRVLAKKEYQDSAIEALKFFNSQIIDELDSYLGNSFVDRNIRIQIPKVLANIYLQRSVDILIANLQTTDLLLRNEIINALNNLRSNDPHLRFDSKFIERRILDEATNYLNILGMLYKQISADGSSEYQTKPEAISPARNALIKLLEERLDQNLQRIFRLLGLRYPPQDMQNAYLGLQSPTPDMRVNAVEYLDNLLEPNLKKYIIPIVETTLVNAMVDRTLDQFGMKMPDEFESLVILLESKDPELQIAALELIGFSGDKRFITHVGALLNKRNPIVRDKAKSTLKELGMVI
jgi:AAA family ATP:ADP antiporter